MVRGFVITDAFVVDEGLRAVGIGRVVENGPSHIRGLLPRDGG